jgi:hypothetical protein
MRQDLDDLLCQRYPEIFRDRRGDDTATAMCRGFCCGDGWFGIIDRLCAAMAREVQAGTIPPVVARQVKGKFGSLRFRIRGGHMRGQGETLRLIEAAEKEADATCEECGQPGELMEVPAWGRAVQCANCTESLLRRR